jgi:hypothetical protein
MYDAKILVLILYALSCALGIAVYILADKLKRATRPITLQDLYPVGTKLYYDEFTERGCKRCLSGKIKVRKRYKTASRDNGKVVVGELARVHWCNQCNYKSASIDKE